MAKPGKKGLLKLKKKDDNQTTISSFFGKQNPSKKTESNLFTKINNHTKVTQTSKNGNNLKVTNSAVQKIKINEDKQKINVPQNCSEIICVDEDEENTVKSPPIEQCKHSEAISPISYSPLASPKCNKIILAENNEKEELKYSSLAAKLSFSSPEKINNSCGGSYNSPFSVDSSPDIICNTPQADNILKNANLARKKKMSSSRSFLRSTDLLAVQPDLKPAHLRNKCRKISKQTSVSICFNKKTNDNDKNIVQDINSGDNIDLVEHSNPKAERAIVPETQVFSEITEEFENTETGSTSEIEEESASPSERHEIRQNGNDAHKTKQERIIEEVLENILEEDTAIDNSDQNNWFIDRKNVKDVYGNDNPLVIGEGKQKSRARLIEALEDTETRKTSVKDEILNNVYIKANLSKGSGLESNILNSNDKLPLKRESEDGLSPKSKRLKYEVELIFNEALSDTDEKSIAKNISEVNFEDNKTVKVKKSNKDRMKMFGFKEKSKLVNEANVSIQDDDLLSEVLGELNQSKTANKNKSKKIMKQNSSGRKVSLENVTLNNTDIELMEATLKEFGMSESNKDIKHVSDNLDSKEILTDCKTESISDNQIGKPDRKLPVENEKQDKECVLLEDEADISGKQEEQLEIAENKDKLEDLDNARNKFIGKGFNNSDDKTRKIESVPTKSKINCNSNSIFQIQEKQTMPPEKTDKSINNLDNDDFDEDSFLSNSLNAALFDGSFNRTPTKSEVKKKTPSEFQFTDLWSRFKVKAIASKEGWQQQLVLSQANSNIENMCTLQGFWADTEIKEGDIVNIIGGEQNGSDFVLNDKSGLIIVSPDTLLSGTLVVSSLFCPRKSVLNDKYKGVDSGNIHMLHGSIIHSLFQGALKENLSSKEELIGLAKSILKSIKFLHDMYSQKIHENSVMEEIKNYIPELLSWLKKHVEFSKPGSRAVKSRADVVVTDIQDIEENIWSPRFGLKGKIDLTVKTRLKTKEGNSVKTIPLELKTGKASFSAEHKGQVTLYSMMSDDRRSDPKQGILLYLKHNKMEVINVNPFEKTGLIQLRNQLVSFLSRKVTRISNEEGKESFSLGHLPPPISNDRACSKCAHLLTCSAYQRLDSSLNLPDKHIMKNLVPEALTHLNSNDLEYFSHWTICLDLEDEEGKQSEQRKIWTKSSKDRESCGDCLSQLVICRSDLGISETQCFSEGKGCSLTFTRDPSHKGLPLNQGGLVCNDMVVVSSEDGRYIALATGFIRKLTSDQVEVVVDRDQLYDTSIYEGLAFRLDRNDGFSTSGLLHTNLCKLMEATSVAEKLRNLIIKLQKPSFQLKMPKNDILKVKSILKCLNKPQKGAILKVLMSKDYVLIKGFPGTGKTSTIVALVKILHLLGQSVLLTSYTHSAVDNILLKLKKDKVPFLRLGRQSRVHPDILPHQSEILTVSQNIDSVQKLEEFYNSYNIVATSCLGTRHSLFDRRRFDVCIVDEASQVLQPACLGPLFLCDKFILVGDPEQLPPLVQSRTAISLGMNQSLFAKLDKQGATFDLNLQYRMNGEILKLSNQLVYDGRLQCGTEEIAKQTLQLPKPEILSDKPTWLQSALSTSIENSVVFLKTDKVSSSEHSDSKGLINVKEGEIVITLLEAFIEAGFDAKNAGVISPYRSQVKYVQNLVQSRSSLFGTEVNTVDQYQGRDKDVIIVSFAKTNNNKSEILNDLHRLNVAMTRARVKLIFVGNITCLSTIKPLRQLIEIVDCNKTIFDVYD